MSEQLVAAFRARLATPLGDVDVGTELRELVERARAEAPQVELDPIQFVGYVAERVTFDRQGRPVLARLHAGAVWIAFGCVTGDRGALAAFETTYAPAIATALARSFDRGLAEDAELALREKLFLVAADDAPRLASYSGHGDLRAWLRAAAVRIAIDLMRARRMIPADPQALDDGLGHDPLLARLKQQYREEFRRAFGEAAAVLTDRECTLLRYRFSDDLSIDEIGALYKVHRATVARWISAIRETLFEGTRTRLMAQLDLDEAEIDSVLRLIDSHLDASLGDAMK